MSSSLTDVYRQVLELSGHDQQELMLRLSLLHAAHADDLRPTPEAIAEINRRIMDIESWEAEIERRRQAIQSGGMETIDARVALQEIQTRLRAE